MLRLRNGPATRVLLGVVLLVAAALLARGARAFWSERAAFRSERRVVALPADARALRLEDVAFATREGLRLRGWYAPSRNRAAIVLVHGSGADRTGVLDEARVLAEGGFGVVLFDLPGRGESAGRVRYAAPERDAVRAAVDLLTRRGDVDPTRIGAFGLSMGGYTLAQVAAEDARIRAVVLAAAPGDAEQQTWTEYARHGIAAQLGAMLALRLRGEFHSEHRRPLDVVGAIAPRPVLMITGTRDLTVPAEQIERLFVAARPPKFLLRIEGAGHGHYVAADASYGRRLREFFARALAVPVGRIDADLKVSAHGPTGP